MLNSGDSNFTLIMQTPENENDSCHPRISHGSITCLFLPVLSCIGAQPRTSLSYDKLPPGPLSLTVLKLDGSSFGIKVPKTATVGELKLAVEAAFNHLPKTGPTRVSWAHVWGKFCLCHDGRKLLSDSDFIRMHRIQDGDQLQFAHHVSSYYNLVTLLEKEVSDSDYELNSYGYKGGQQTCEEDDINGLKNVEDKHVDDVELDNSFHSQRECRITRFLSGWFSYRKLRTAP